jgi:dipicolinate synthase subunit A
MLRTAPQRTHIIRYRAIGVRRVNSFITQTGFVVLGGDQRQVELCRLAENRGYRVKALGLDGQQVVEELWRVDLCQETCVLFPVPMQDREGNILMPLHGAKISADEAAGAVADGAVVFAGMPCKVLTQRAKSGEITLYDLNAIETFAIKNAVLSVEGALACAITLSPISLHGSRCLVMGFGRIGRLLGRALKDVGADVSIAARRPESQAWANAEGFSTLGIQDISSRLDGYDHLFNTVPARVIPDGSLKNIRQDSLILELASKPYGFDPEKAKGHGLNYHIESGLPGRYSPKSAAMIILDTVEQCLKNGETQV